jgi:hypothetical protein
VFALAAALPIELWMPEARLAAWSALDDPSFLHDGCRTDQCMNAARRAVEDFGHSRSKELLALTKILAFESPLKDLWTIDQLLTICGGLGGQVAYARWAYEVLESTLPRQTKPLAADLSVAATGLAVPRSDYFLGPQGEVWVRTVVLRQRMLLSSASVDCFCPAEEGPLRALRPPLDALRELAKAVAAG